MKGEKVGYTLKLDLSARQLKLVRALLAEDMDRARREGSSDTPFPVAVARVHEGLEPYGGASTLKLDLTEYEIGALRVILRTAVARAERDGAPTDASRVAAEVMSMVDDYRAVVEAIKRENG